MITEEGVIQSKILLLLLVFLRLNIIGKKKQVQQKVAMYTGEGYHHLHK